MFHLSFFKKLSKLSVCIIVNSTRYVSVFAIKVYSSTRKVGIEYIIGLLVVVVSKCVGLHRHSHKKCFQTR